MFAMLYSSHPFCVKVKSPKPNLQTSGICLRRLCFMMSTRTLQGGIPMMKRLLGLLGTVTTMMFLLVEFAPAQSPEAGRLFEQNCMTCHGNAAVERAPDPSVLRQMTPEAVYKALTSGAMVPQAEKLSDEQKRIVAEYLGGRNIVEGRGGAAQ